MRINRGLFTALPLCAGVLFACNNPSSGDSTTSTSASASASAMPQATVPPVMSASAALEAKRPRMHGGPAGMLFHAARELPDLKDPQKATLEKISDTMKDEGPKTEFKDFQAELITEVKAGKVETAKLDPKMKAIDATMQTRIDKEADGLNQLHAALEPAQRKEVTAAVRAKQTQMEDRWNKMRETMGGGKADVPPKPEDMAKKRVERLTKDLDLDATQQTTVQGFAIKLAPKPGNPVDMRAEWKKNMDNLLGEFEKDSFDAKKLDFHSQANKKGHTGLQYEVDFLTQLVPVLKPDQRDKLATKLEHPMMGGHGPGPGGEGHTGFEKHWAGPWQDDEMGPPGSGAGPMGGAPPPGGAAPTQAAPAPQAPAKP